MSDRIMPGPASCGRDNCEAVCIHTRKIYDSCRDKDCIEDLRFYPVMGGQEILDRAQSIRSGKARLLYTYVDVAPVSFNRGFYTVDMRFYYSVVLNVAVCGPRATEVEGLCIFDKRVVLCGGEGNSKTFFSGDRMDAMDRARLEMSDMPVAVVEAVDPIVLGVKLVDHYDDHCGCGCSCGCDCCDVPRCVCDCFGGELTMGDGEHRAYVSLGQFSMVRLERDTQLLVPAFGYCIPEKECSGCGNEVRSGDPCELFRSISFPMNDFFPSADCCDHHGCGCGCDNSFACSSERSCDRSGGNDRSCNNDRSCGSERSCERGCGSDRPRSSERSCH